MKIVRRCPISGKENTMEINCTEQEYEAWLNGELIQKAMPNVPPEEREFIISGFTPEIWNKTFNLPEE